MEENFVGNHGSFAVNSFLLLWSDAATGEFRNLSESASLAIKWVEQVLNLLAIVLVAKFISEFRFT